MSNLAPPAGESFLQYSWDSLVLGAQQLENALASDFAGLESLAQGTFPGTASPSTDPNVLAQRSAELGPFAGTASLLDQIDPSSPSYNPAAFPNLFRDILIIGGIVALVALSPTINSLSARRR